MTDCGSSRESCCTSPEVPGGMYYRTYSNIGDGGPTAEDALATVSGFRLDKYLVTVGRFRQFVSAWNGVCYRPPAGSGKHAYLNGGRGLVDIGGVETYKTYEPGWVASNDDNVGAADVFLVTSCDNGSYSTWTSSAGSQENVPINCVNWYDAYAFCIWDGGFLPSEAEWEYAAAGGSEQRTFPWGSTPPGDGNQYAIYNCGYPSGLGICTGPGPVNIAPVGTATLGVGAWGQLDLAGEVREWNLDWYEYPYYVPGCVDCAYVTQTAAYGPRVTRGGEFADPTSSLLPQYRDGNTPRLSYDAVGFRCARAP